MLIKNLMFFLFVNCVCFPALANNNRVIQLGTKVEWKPYHVNTAEGADGTAVRVVACILTRMGQPFEIQKLPWARVQQSVKHGTLDGFFAASRNTERDTYATLSKLFVPQKRVFYLNKRFLKFDEAKYNASFIKDKIRVSARNGSNALHSLRTANFTVHAHPRTQYQLLNMLDKGRIEAILENSLVFENMVQETKRSMADYLQITYQTKNMGVYFGHKFLQDKPSFIAKFNQNIVPCAGKILE